MQQTHLSENQEILMLMAHYPASYESARQAVTAMRARLGPMNANAYAHREPLSFLLPPEPEDYTEIASALSTLSVSPEGYTTPPRNSWGRRSSSPVEHVDYEIFTTLDLTHDEDHPIITEERVYIPRHLNEEDYVQIDEALRTHQRTFDHQNMRVPLEEIEEPPIRRRIIYDIETVTDDGLTDGSYFTDVSDYEDF